MIEKRSAAKWHKVSRLNDPKILLSLVRGHDSLIHCRTGHRIHKNTDRLGHEEVETKHQERQPDVQSPLIPKTQSIETTRTIHAGQLRSSEESTESSNTGPSRAPTEREDETRK